METPPKKYKIKRLWHEFASVRDYIVKETMEKKQDLEIILLGTKEIMTISCERLSKGKLNPERFRSRHNSEQIYSLVDFYWKPDKSPQRKLF